ncbi:MAG: ATP-binding protein [Acetobacteraceae bacterium]
MDWGELRAEIFDVFTPGPPINELAMFVGRQDVVRRLQDIAIERGRHAIIFGERGVGKTSLAAIFHKQLNIVGRDSEITIRSVVDIHVNADSRDSFDSLWRKVFRRISRGPNTTLTADLDYTGPVEPDHVLLEMERFNPTQMPIIVIDEYDRVQDEECRVLMTDVIKGLTISKRNPTIILVGVADDISQLVYDHKSIAARNLSQVHMKRMSKEEVTEIVSSRVKRLRMTISDDAVWRIAYFSAGLPFYAHSLGKYAALSAVSKESLKIDEGVVLKTLDDCMADVDYSITESYTRATERIYRKENIFREVLAACAIAETNDLGQFRAVAVEGPLSAIVGRAMKVSSFASHLNEMCGPERGSILRKTGERRTYHYHFGEAAMQPFVVMKSLTDGVLQPNVMERFRISRQRSLSI